MKTILKQIANAFENIMGDPSPKMSEDRPACTCCSAYHCSPAEREISPKERRRELPPASDPLR
jgi:hypothetical protein